MARRNATKEKVEGLQERIRNCREASGYTLDSLANILGITKSAVRNYETGVSEPGLSDLIKMSNLFGVSVEHLLCLTGVESGFRPKHRSLNELQRVVMEILNSGEGSNATSGKRIIGDVIRTFTEILEENKAITTVPQKDKSLSQFENLTAILNAAVMGEEPPKPNPHHHIRVDAWQPYDVIKLFKDLLIVFLEYCRSGKQEYAPEEYRERTTELRRKMREIEEKIEESAFRFAKIKGGE